MKMEMWIFERRELKMAYMWVNIKIISPFIFKKLINKNNT